MAETLEQSITRPSYLSQVRSNSVLDPEAKKRLESRYLDSFSTIDKIREMNTRAQLDNVRLESDRFKLDQARKAAAREEEEIGEASRVDADIDAIINDATTTPEQKSATLARRQLGALDGRRSRSFISDKYRIAQYTLPDAPKAAPELTPAAVVSLIQDGADPEIVRSGDLTAIGQEAQRIQAAKLAGETKKDADEKAAKALADAQAKRSRFQSDVDDLEFFSDDDTGTIDESRFRKDAITKARIKRALSTSPDPELRKIGQTESNAKKLREAYEKDLLLDAASPSAPATGKIKWAPR